MVCECNKLTVNIQPKDLVQLHAVENYGFISFLQWQNMTMKPVTKNFISKQDRASYNLDLSKWIIPGHPPTHDYEFVQMAQDVLNQFHNVYFIGDNSIKTWYNIFRRQLVERPVCKMMFVDGSHLTPTDGKIFGNKFYKSINAEAEPNQCTQPGKSIAFVSQSQPFLDPNYLFYSPDEVDSLAAIKNEGFLYSKKILLFIGLSEHWSLFGLKYFENRLVKIRDYLLQNPLSAQQYKIIFKTIDYKIPKPHLCTTSFSPYILDQMNQIIKRVMAPLYMKEVLIFADSWSHTLALSESINRMGKIDSVINKEIIKSSLKKLKSIL